MLLSLAPHPNPSNSRIRPPELVPVKLLLREAQHCPSFRKLIAWAWSFDWKAGRGTNFLSRLVFIS